MHEQGQDLKDPTGTDVGDMIGAVIRHAIAAQLSDYFIGSIADFETSEGRVYFSDEIQEEALDNLVRSLQTDKIQVRLEKSDQEGAEYMLVVSGGSVEGDDAGTTGRMDVAVDLTGEIPVKHRGENA